MKLELQNILFDRYPAMFVKRHLPLEESAMHWGIETWDGWFELIDQLCADLQRLTDDGRAPQVVTEQVKDKFGRLRFRIEDPTPIQAECINAAEDRSMHICVVCGNQGKQVRVVRFGSTRCEEHLTTNRRQFEAL